MNRTTTDSSVGIREADEPKTLPAVAIDRLRELAEAATPGPWAYRDMRPNTYGPAFVDAADVQNLANCGDAVGRSETHGFCLTVDCDVRMANAAFIAAANPQTILSLITAYESQARPMSDAPTVPIGSLRAQAPSVPTEGREAAVLVPREPTEAMIEAGAKAAQSAGAFSVPWSQEARVVWSAMIAATQQATGEGGEYSLWNYPDDPDHDHNEWSVFWTTEGSGSEIARGMTREHAGLFLAALSTQQAVSPPEGPGGWLVKDFADGWYWTGDRLNADMAANGGACVYRIESGEYETRAPDAIGEEKGAGE